MVRRAWRDSNPRPTDSKSAALSTELQALDERQPFSNGSP